MTGLLSDSAVYWSLVLVQFPILWWMHRLAVRPDLPVLSVRNLMQPNYWVIAWWFLGFLVPQILYPFNGYPVLGMEGASEQARRTASIMASSALVQYGLCCLLGLAILKVFTDKRIPKILEIRAPTLRERQVALLFTLVGFVGFLYLFVVFRDTGGPRSGLVKTAPGRLAYALSFYFTFGASFFIAHLLTSGKRAPGLAMALGVGVFMFFLGGRGRVLWPTVLTLCFLGVSSNRRLRPVPLFFVMIALYAVLGTLDPLFMLLQDGDQTKFLEKALLYANIQDIALDRLFNSFTNIALGVYYDDLPHKASYLWNMDEAGQAFMVRFFPQVYFAGVGFNMGFPSEWFFALGFKGFPVGGLFLGLFLGAVRWGYLRTHDPLILWSYLLAAQWITSVNGMMFSAGQKIIAAAIPPLVIWAIARFVWRPRSSSAPTGNLPAAT